MAHRGKLFSQISFLKNAENFKTGMGKKNEGFKQRKKPKTKQHGLE